MVHQYDPKNISVIVGGKIIHGFSDGTWLRVIRNEQSWNLKVGVDGEGTRARNNNTSGHFELELMQSSSSNDDLSGFLAADEQSGTGAVPVLVRDNNGTTLATCLTGWVQKWADSDFSKETAVRKWIIETDQLNIFVGGEVFA
jgi:hypothetical protein